jgi:hypothetical protein
MHIFQINASFKMNPRVRNVMAGNDYLLKIWFDNGEIMIFDLKPYLNTGRFVELKEISLFNSVKPFLRSVQWSNGLDLCPDTLYQDGIKSQ